MTKFLSDLEVDLSKWLYNNNEPVYKNYGSLFPPLSKNKKVNCDFLSQFTSTILTYFLRIIII